MRIIFWSIIIVVLSFGAFIDPSDVGLPLSDQDYTFYRSMATLFMAIMVVLEGLAIMIRHPEVPDPAAEAEAAAKAAAARAAREAKIAELEAEKVRLTNALQDTEAHSASLNAALKAKAESKGDVEVMNFLALLQSKGRFVDFLMDDVSKYPDGQVAAAARVVHQGCIEVVRDYFDIKPVEKEAEGAMLTLAKDYDAFEYKLLGNVQGEPPFRGRVLHRGWRTERITLPRSTLDQANPDFMKRAQVIAPAEVELH